MKTCVLILTLAGLPMLVAAQTPQTEAHVHADGMQHDSTAQPVRSTTLTVQGPAKTLTFSLPDLQAMPQTTLTAHNEHSKTDEVYAGPRLADVLAKVGLVLATGTQHDLLHTFLIAGGTDGYFVVYSAAEVEPQLHKAEVIVAITKDGRPLDRTGAFQLIDAQDTKPARWVRNLNQLSLKLQNGH